MHKEVKAAALACLNASVREAEARAARQLAEAELHKLAAGLIDRACVTTLNEAARLPEFEADTKAILTALEAAS